MRPEEAVSLHWQVFVTTWVRYLTEIEITETIDVIATLCWPVGSPIYVPVRQRPFRVCETRPMLCEIQVSITIPSSKRYESHGMVRPYITVVYFDYYSNTYKRIL